MTKRPINKATEDSKDFYRLSIQISLNGLSFCIIDTLHQEVLSYEYLSFPKELSPYLMLKELQSLLEEHAIVKTDFSEVVVIHRNNLFTLVPKPLFDENELANYLKFNAKILANDHISHDEIAGYDLMNVYVPFMNVNNYLYELFGEFTYKHHSTVLVQSLLNEHAGVKEPIVYAHVFEKELDIAVITHKKLLLFNNFAYDTQEDFLYYLLFTLEQLQLDPDTVTLRLLGDVQKDDSVYRLCYEYVKQVSIFVPTTNPFPRPTEEIDTIDFTVLNAL